MDNAFEKARAAYGTGAYDDATMEFLFPQLKESEDERARKGLITFLNQPPIADKITFEARVLWLAYLEKQKENPKNADSISADCASDAKCENSWHRVADSLPDDAREVICKDAIGNFFIGRYYHTSASWEVMVYDDCPKSNEDNPPVVMWVDIPSEKQGEQKPVILPIDKDTLTKIKEIVDGYFSEHVTREVYKRWLDEHYNVWKPAEWSEEDERILKGIIGLIDHDQHYGVSNKEMLDWLESLHPQPNKEIYQAAKHDLAIRFMNYLDENRPEGKIGLSNAECEDIDKAFKEGDWAKIMRYYEKYRPSWKPSEEQMGAFCRCVDYLEESDNEDADIMAELYEQLKKLM